MNHKTHNHLMDMLTCSHNYFTSSDPTYHQPSFFQEQNMLWNSKRKQKKKLILAGIPSLAATSSHLISNISIKGTKNNLDKPGEIGPAKRHKRRLNNLEASIDATEFHGYCNPSVLGHSRSNTAYGLLLIYMWFCTHKKTSI